MPLVALVCAGLLGFAEGNPPSPDVLAEYQHVRATAGHTADDQVRLALWCEAHGLTAEQVRHLALAVLADPTHITARGLAGFVARNGHWQAPDLVAQAIRADSRVANLLTGYDQRRSRTPYTADAQWDLGQWAESRGLTEQAKAHFTAVTRLNANHEAAWNRLGYKKHGQRWQTEAQIEADKRESEALRKSEQVWYPILLKCRTMLAHPAERDQAQATLDRLSDPHAWPTVWSIFGHGTAANQLVAAQLFSQLPGGSATVALADLAVHGRSPAVFQAALDRLATRDPRDCIEPLIKQIQTPWVYQIRTAGTLGSPVELFAVGEKYNVKRVYAPPPDLRELRFGPPQHHGLYHRTAEPASEEHVVALHNQHLARRAVQDKIKEIEAENSRIREATERVPLILAKLTGLDLGTDAAAWVQWNTERTGGSHHPNLDPVFKPTYTRIIQPSYETAPPPPPHHACFGAGTPVRTINGITPIEQVQIGDLVLAQDTASGALSYRPVLTAFHNPPSATYRIKLGADEVVATGIHRFWQAGKGWIMARDLKPGESLRVLGGVASVESVTAEKTQPVYNLEVAEGRSFFVGRLGALVHDNSLVEPTPTPFDAPRAVVATR